jgi:hypothetical protein
MFRPILLTAVVAGTLAGFAFGALHDRYASKVGSKLGIPLWMARDPQTALRWWLRTPAANLGR